jgi:large subunit ribosomal protein L29
MKFKEIKALSQEELEKKLIELKRELMKEQVQISTGTSPKSPGKLREMKKTVAKVLSLLEVKN